MTEQTDDCTPAGLEMSIDEFKQGLITPEDLRTGNIHTHDDVLNALNRQ